MQMHRSVSYRLAWITGDAACATAAARLAVVVAASLAAAAAVVDIASCMHLAAVTADIAVTIGVTYTGSESSIAGHRPFCQGGYMKIASE